MSPRIPPRVFARDRAILRLTSESGRDGSLSFPAGVVRRLVRSFLLVRFDTFVGFDFLGLTLPAGLEGGLGRFSFEAFLGSSARGFLATCGATGSMRLLGAFGLHFQALSFPRQWKP